MSDVNTEFDKGASVTVDASVTDLYKRTHRGRRGRTWYSYHVHIVPLGESNPQIDTPRQIQIGVDLFRQPKKGGTLRMEIAPGRLHYPWYRSMQAVDW